MMLKKGLIVEVKNQNLDGKEINEGKAKLLRLIIKDIYREYWKVEFLDDEGRNEHYNRWINKD